MGENETIIDISALQALVMVLLVFMAGVLFGVAVAM